ncbi:MAG: hypothetical protein ISS72_07255, partial [Candidatus Brocadiae bacterium]|nr:hypothetical protein [Candidatus Brocadiia bacterium]
VNYHLRTIAHNTMLVRDPSETWPRIRAGRVTGNDGGQHHAWPHHNGAVVDARAWQSTRTLHDIADIVAFEDRREYLYVAGDCSRAYSPKKLEYFTRQIVFIRPGTFIVFDRIKSRSPSFRKTWLLQAMAPPQSEGRTWSSRMGRAGCSSKRCCPKTRRCAWRAATTCTATTASRIRRANPGGLLRSAASRSPPPDLRSSTTSFTS